MSPVYFLVVFAVLIIATGVKAQTTGSSSFRNIALARNVSSSSTCGRTGRQQYCIVASLVDEKCFYCDASNPLEEHPPSKIVDPELATKYTWWQSENGVHNVTVQLDFETVFTFTHLVLTFRSFRPAAMVLQRSVDFGRTWTEYQYFARDCRRTYGMAEKNQNERVSLDEVICTSEYSTLEPSTNGEVVFSTVPPSVPIQDPYDPQVIARLSVTNLRIRLDKLNTLGDDLLDPRPEILRKYFYAIYDWTVNGRCQCNGHAETCVPVENTVFDPRLQASMVHGQCECAGNTAGLNCERCQPLYNNRAWRPRLACQRCQCYEHADSCDFDANVYRANGNRDGGVCKDCKDNTAGNQCEKCADGFYPLPGKLLNAKDRCASCECDPLGSLENGTCAQESDVLKGIALGDCRCKPNLIGQKCRRCKPNTWNLSRANPDGCEDCDCYTGGTLGGSASCHIHTGQCMCKMYVTGRRCDECKPGYYMMRRSNPDGCKNCNCDPGGALDHRCNQLTGQCLCRSKIRRHTCSAVWPGYFFQNLDYLLFEAEYMTLSAANPIHRIRQDVVTWTGHGFASVEMGSAVSFLFNNISMTMPYHFLIRYESRLNSPAFQVMVTVTHIPGPNGFHIDALGNVSRCKDITSGHSHQFMLDLKVVGGEDYFIQVEPFCLIMHEQYEVTMRFRTIGSSSGTILIDSVVLLPTVDSIGILNDLMLQQQWVDNDCYNRRIQVSTHSQRSEVCERLMFSMSAIINNGTIPCDCDRNGSTSSICLPFEGQCSCKPGVFGRRCDACAPGHYAMTALGCAACNCEPSGSLSLFCNTETGQCPCMPGRSGARCDNCEQYSYYNRQTGQCIDCNCDETGSSSLECATNVNGTCSCKPGVGGRKCTKCLPGYYGFSDSGCAPCRCNDTGSLGKDCDETGQCLCKDAVTGKACDQCSADAFSNPGFDGGCQSCFCNTFGTECSAAVGWSLTAYMSDFQDDYDFDGWRVDKGTVRWERGYLLGEPGGSSRSMTWVASEDFLGDFRTAYSQQLQFSLRQSAEPSDGLDPPLTYVYLHRSNNPNIKLYHILSPPPSDSWTQYKIQFMPIHWRYGKMSGNIPEITDLRQLLADISELHISTTYPSGYTSEAMQQALDDVQLSYAIHDSSNDSSAEIATHVEQCVCPEGREGRVCGQCSRGWTHDPPNSGEFAPCVRCFCFGHSAMCDPNSGECINCTGNTHGDKCQHCLPGYYGNARRGVCQPCQCPGGISGNQFAKTCVKDSNCPDGIQCQCETGYIGCKCDTCDRGYFGQPRLPGGKCSNCSCSNNGPPGDLDNCDRVTGRCKICLYNTSGHQCDTCADGFFGDAVNRQCQPCDCDPTGSEHGICDPFSGKCHCKMNVDGRRCDRCAADHYGFSGGSGCVPCLCCQGGSVSTQCDQETGKCQCHPNIGGDDDARCCFCQSGYWNYSSSGCQACDCHPDGSLEQLCDAKTGTCLCKPNVIGDHCEKCRAGTSGILPSCEPCGECYDTWLEEVDRISGEVNNLTERAKMITNSGNLGEYEEEFKEMEAKLKKANDIIGKGLSSHTKVLQSSHKIDMLEAKLGEMGRRVQHLNELITDTETQNREVNSDIDELCNQLGIAEREIDSIEYQASQVNSSSLKGIIDGIRAAGERSEQAEESVNASSAVVDQAIKVKDHAAALIGDKFKEKQNKIPLDLTDADMELKKFDDIIRKANEEVCGRAGDSCEACGGVGCNNRCGGPTCPGAVNDTTHALMNANEARLLAEKKKNESDSIASELQVAQKAIIDAEKAAQEATTKAESAEAIASEVYENVTNLNWQLHQFREGDADRADPDEIREMAEYVLGKKPLSVATMHDLVNNSRTLLRNIEPSLVEVDDLYKQLYANATIVRKTALTFSDVTKRAEIASKDVEQLLQEAAKYQTAARDNLTEAEPYVDAAGEITSDARRKVEEADSLLETVSAKISKMEKDADDVEKKADDNNGLYNKAKQKVNDVKSALEHTQDNLDLLDKDLLDFINKLNASKMTANTMKAKANELRVQAATLFTTVTDGKSKLMAFEETVTQNSRTIAGMEGRLEGMYRHVQALARDIGKKADHLANCRPEDEPPA